jgi:hypothetical protein
MEHNIGVGIAVGLVTTIGIGIYNYVSNYASIKEEKKYKQVLEVENKSKNEFQQKKESLKNLRDNGILTDAEFNLKVKKIDEENDNQNLLKSEYYIKIKKLYEEGIFDEQEFENKIKILKEKGLDFPIIKKGITVGENSTIIKDDETIEFKVKFISSNHSFKFGDFKSWTIQFENSEILNFYTRNSNSSYFISVNNTVKNFYSREDFIVYEFKNR